MEDHDRPSRTRDQRRQRYNNRPKSDRSRSANSHSGRQRHEHQDDRRSQSQRHRSSERMSESVAQTLPPEAKSSGGLFSRFFTPSSPKTNKRSLGKNKPVEDAGEEAQEVDPVTRNREPGSFMPKPSSPPGRPTDLIQETDALTHLTNGAGNDAPQVLLEVQGKDDAQRLPEIPLNTDGELTSQFESGLQYTVEGKLQGVIQAQKTEIDKLSREKNEALRNLSEAKEEIKQLGETHKLEIKNKDAMIDRLRTKATQTASRNTEIPTQSPLRHPESEIIKAWRQLAYEVGNFVNDNFDKVRGRSMANWASSQARLLESITPYYDGIIGDKKEGIKLIEATMWAALVDFVFSDLRAEPCFHWAGKRARELSRLSKKLHKGVRDSGLGNGLVLFHQWKAWTTSLASSISPQSDLDERIDYIVEDMEEVLELLRSKEDWKSCRQQLRSIVKNAIAVDKMFCGQEAWYVLAYPHEGRDGLALDQSRMKVVSGSESSQRVSFVVRPMLCCAGSPPGMRYNKYQILDKCHVCLH